MGVPRMSPETSFEAQWGYSKAAWGWVRKLAGCAKTYFQWRVGQFAPADLTDQLMAILQEHPVPPGIREFRYNWRAMDLEPHEREFVRSVLLFPLGFECYHFNSTGTLQICKPGREEGAYWGDLWEATMNGTQVDPDADPCEYQPFLDAGYWPRERWEESDTEVHTSLDMLRAYELLENAKQVYCPHQHKYLGYPDLVPFKLSCAEQQFNLVVHRVSGNCLNSAGYADILQYLLESDHPHQPYYRHLL